MDAIYVLSIAACFVAVCIELYRLFNAQPERVTIRELIRAENMAVLRARDINGANGVFAQACLMRAIAVISALKTAASYNTLRREFAGAATRGDILVCAFIRHELAQRNDTRGIIDAIGCALYNGHTELAQYLMCRMEMTESIASRAYKSGRLESAVVVGSQFSTTTSRVAALHGHINLINYLERIDALDATAAMIGAINARNRDLVADMRAKGAILHSGWIAAIKIDEPAIINLLYDAAGTDNIYIFLTACEFGAQKIVAQMNLPADLSMGINRALFNKHTGVLRALARRGVNLLQYMDYHEAPA